jgi:hypothetical protein
LAPDPAAPATGEPAPQRYDPAAAAAVITRALLVIGGVELVLGSLATIPGVARTPARAGMFRSSPERLQVGEWRYEAARDGRLVGAHVVGGIVLAELALSPEAAGASVAAALGQLVAAYGAQTIPAVRSVLEGLAVAAGP